MSLPEVELRGVTADDAMAVRSLLQGDTALALQTATMPIPYTLESAQHFLSTNPVDVFAITVRGDLVGMVGWSRSDDLAEIGYWVGRIHWGRGYATTAVELLIRQARRRGIVNFIAEVFPDNPASMRVLEKNGFARVGEVDRDLPLRGGLRRLIRFWRDFHSVDFGR